MNYKLSLILITTLIISVFSLEQSIVNENVERTIDLTSQLAKVQVRITLKNNGKQPIKHYKLPENPEEKGVLSYISAKETSSKLSIDHSGKTRTITLQSSLEPGKTTQLTIEYVLAKSLEPYPAKITQRERQLVRFTTTQNLYSPYPTTESKTIIKLSSRTVENYTKLKPVQQNDATLTYGPNKQVPAGHLEKIMVHLENNSPFLTVTNLLRTVEVSHWGNIAIEEFVDMLHTGATLKGSFSR